MFDGRDDVRPSTRIPWNAAIHLKRHERASPFASSPHGAAGISFRHRTTFARARLTGIGPQDPSRSQLVRESVSPVLSHSCHRPSDQPTAAVRAAWQARATIPVGACEYSPLDRPPPIASTDEATAIWNNRLASRPMSPSVKADVVQTRSHGTKDPLASDPAAVFGSSYQLASGS